MVGDLADEAAESFQAARNSLEQIQMAIVERQKAIVAMTAQMSGVASELVPFRGNTTSNYETRAAQYISADIGLARAQAIDSTFFYLGTNIYTGPVNKKAPLAWSDQSFRKRFAFLFAIPLNPFSDDPNEEPVRRHLSDSRRRHWGPTAPGGRRLALNRRRETHGRDGDVQGT